MEAEQAPFGVLELVELGAPRFGKLLAADQLLERLVHVDGRGDELARAHGAAVGKFNAGRLAALDHDAVDVDLRLIRAAGGDELFHQAAREIEGAALAELVAALEVEGADDRAHRRGLRRRIDEPGAEQRHLEQEEQAGVLVLEQLAHDFERLAGGDLEKLAAERGLRQERIALGLRQRLGEALRQEDFGGDLLGDLVPLAKCLRVLLREAGEVCDRLLEIAAEHQRRAVGVRLAELVARRDVGDALVEPEVLEPRRLADVEMIDRVQIVIEARQRHLTRAQAAAIGQPPLDEQYLQARPREISAEDQAVMAGPDDDAVIGFLERLRHRTPPPVPLAAAQ